MTMRNILFFIMSLGCFSTLLYAEENPVTDPFAGKYQLVTPPVPTVDPQKIEIVELFWYTCPHCYYFEEHFLSPWLAKQAADVQFVHIPAVFGEKNVFFAKVYYAAEALNLLDKVHTPLFKALHDQNRTLDETAVMNLFAQYATDKDTCNEECKQAFNQTFKKTFDSFSVDSKVRRANELTLKYGNQSVPTIIINGKYRLSSEMTDGYVKMMEIMDHLVGAERKNKVKSVAEPKN